MTLDNDKGAVALLCCLRERQSKGCADTMRRAIEEIHKGEKVRREDANLDIGMMHMLPAAGKDDGPSQEEA